MSRVIGLCMVKNEADIIEMTIRHFIAEGLDRVIVANNLSTDGTDEILNNLVNEFNDYIAGTNPLLVFEDSEPAYYQAMKMNAWINEFVKYGDWVIPFDADEIWYHTEGMSLKHFFEECEANVVECPVYDMVPNSVDTKTSKPSRDILWKSPDHELYPVVAFRYMPGIYLYQGNHNVQASGYRTMGAIEVRHFQYRSFEQFRAKLRNGREVYQITDLDYGIGYHWREGGKLTDNELHIKWEEYCNQPTVLDPCYPKGQK